jgi:hypothetical protein
MTPDWKLATLIPGTETPTSIQRELPPFMGNMLPQRRLAAQQLCQRSAHRAGTRRPREDQPRSLQ